MRHPFKLTLFRNVFSAAAFVLAVYLSTSCGILPEERVYERAPTVVANTTSPFEYTTVVRGDIEIRQTVRLEYAPTQEASLSFSIGGLLFKDIYVNQGSQVTEGQLLAELEAADIDLVLSEANDEIDFLELELSQMIERQALEEGRLLLELDQRQLDQTSRDEQLADLARQQEAARQALENSIYIKGLAREQMEMQSDERRIFAPFDATVAYVREKNEGDRSQVDETIIRLAVSESSMFVGRTNIPDHFEFGAEMMLTVGDDEMPAIVVNPSDYGIETEETDPEEENPDVPVYLRLAAENIVLETRTRADISILLDASRDSLLLDTDALHDSEGRSFVYVESDDGLREVKFIEIGLQNSNWTEIRSGLEEGERVILD